MEEEEAPAGRLVNNSQENEKRFTQIRQISRILNTSIESADLKLILYLSSAWENSGVLCPGPPGFDQAGEEKLIVANQSIPSTHLLKYLLQRPYYSQLPQETMDIIHWNLVSLKEPRVVPLEQERIQDVLSKAGSGKINSLVPNRMFKLMYSTTSTLEMKWQAICHRYSKQTKFAYYSTQIHNFHSLIHNGMEKIGEEEDGIRLWADLTACLGSTKSSWVWGKSSIGININVIAIVEYIDDPVRPPTVTDAYSFLIERSELLRIRYLLVYIHKKGSPILSPKGTHAFGFGRAALGLALLAVISALKMRPSSLGTLAKGIVTMANDAGSLISGKIQQAVT